MTLRFVWRHRNLKHGRSPIRCTTGRWQYNEGSGQSLLLGYYTQLKPATLVLFATSLFTCAISQAGSINIAQFHNHLSRDGLFVDPAFTKVAAGSLQRAIGFDGRISGNVHAQPLYVESITGGPAMVIVATESNYVYALNADDGTVIWRDRVGPPAPSNIQQCGPLNPLGITGTPVVDLASRSLLLDAVITPDALHQEHLVYSLNVDTGATNSGWPVMTDGARSGTAVLISASANQRGALGVLNGTVYVPYGGHNGDCGTYWGWLVGIPLNDPRSIITWATAAQGGGAWAIGGVASDGADLFIATGNTFGATAWSGGEAIIRFQPGPAFSGSSVDYWAPTNWMALDTTDVEVGGSGPLLVDVPGAQPAALIVALGKDGNAYLLNRTNLGGISVPVAQSHVVGTTNFDPIIQAAATYRTGQGTYVAFITAHTQHSLTSFLITPTSPPTITNVWSISAAWGSPFVTSTDGTNDVVVWAVGAGTSTERLYGYDGDTGAIVYSGGGTNELMSGTEPLSTAIAARGRIYIANDNQVSAFTVPVSPIVLTNFTVSSTNGFQFTFTNVPGMSFTAFESTNISQPLTNWTRLGKAIEVAPGQFQFATGAGLIGQGFYDVRSP